MTRRWKIKVRMKYREMTGYRYRGRIMTIWCVKTYFEVGKKVDGAINGKIK